MKIRDVRMSEMDQIVASLRNTKVVFKLGIFLRLHNLSHFVFRSGVTCHPNSAPNRGW